MFLFYILANKPTIKMTQTYVNIYIGRGYIGNQWIYRMLFIPIEYEYWRYLLRDVEYYDFGLYLEYIIGL